MFKTKPSNGNLSRQKKHPPRPKPEFSTDFIDRQQYKLSQTEMIQKKASLQSKHREEAIQQLQERRKKLQQGIIDQDTRKVYETALTSKKIDINPPIRKNLSQMIRYQRDRQEQQMSNSRQKPRRAARNEFDYGNQEDESQDQQTIEIEKQLKDTKNFIKKFQRAKKVDDIGRAVEILTDTVTGPRKPERVSRDKSKQKSPKKNPMSNPMLTGLKQSKVSAVSSEQDALSSIEDTIRFMEERLFSAKRIDKIKKEEAQKFKDSTLSLTEQSSPFVMKKQVDPRQNLELSGLGYHQSDMQDECMLTIRRMKDMMQGNQRASPLKLKQNCYMGNKSPKFDGISTLQKITPNAHMADSQAEIDFSLTLNESDPPSVRPNREEAEVQDRQYERIKRELFEEVNKLHLQTPEPSVIEPSFQSFQAKASFPIMDQSSIPDYRNTPTPPPKSRKVNSELAKLKNQVNGIKNSVEAITVEPMAIVRPGQIMGTDFRGSINIKKHIVQK